jgi:hypothetical protein
LRDARIVICGAISQYDNTTPIKGPSNDLMLVVSRARMHAMVVLDYADPIWMPASRQHRVGVVHASASIPPSFILSHVRLRHELVRIINRLDSKGYAKTGRSNAARDLSLVNV